MSVYPDDVPVPADLKAAYSSADFLLQTSQIIVALLAPETPNQVASDAVQRATERAMDLRRKIKKCEVTILKVTNEITSANRETVKIASRSHGDFPNAHRAALDIGALVCELMWDGCYRERGFDSEEELYSLPLDAKTVEAGLPYITDQLRGLLSRQDWRELRGRLLIERDTTACARLRGLDGRIVGRTGRGDDPPTPLADGTIKDSLIWLKGKQYKLARGLRELLSYLLLNPDVAEETVNRHCGMSVSVQPR
jgi:hypothetical protein